MRRIAAILPVIFWFLFLQKLVLPAASSSSSGNTLSPGRIQANGTCMANGVSDIQYLVFWPPLPGATPEGLGESIRALGVKLGTGDGKTRQLGFGAFIPIFVGSESIIPQAINL